MEKIHVLINLTITLTDEAYLIFLYVICHTFFVSVTFTACVQPSLPFNTEIIKFNSIKVHVGIESLRSFMSFGLFTCELPGLYLVDTSVVSNAVGSLFSIRKNGTTVVQSGVSKDGKYESASLAAAVELNVGDTIDIYAINNVYSLALGSCVTIVKIS